MKITYINRNLSAGYSVKRAFDPIVALVPDSEEIEVPYSGTGLKNLLSNLYFTYKHRNLRGINHITGDIYYSALALPKKNTVVTYLDAGALRFWKGSFIKKILFKYLWFYWPLKRATYVTCISETTKQVLTELFPWCEPKLHAVYIPIMNDLAYVPKEFNDTNPQILHVGTGPSKNLKRVVKALSGIDCHLRIIGNLSDEIIELLKSEKVNYSNATNISDSQIVEEYQKCDIVSFPSTHEGFGLPLIEGYASGRIVVSSNIDPMKTLSEGAAILVDPLSVDSVREGFQKAILDKETRVRCIEHGLEIAKKYRATEIYRQYLDIYKQMIN